MPMIRLPSPSSSLLVVAFTLGACNGGEIIEGSATASASDSTTDGTTDSTSATTSASATMTGTATMKAWLQFRRRNPAAKLVCLDLQPYRTSQAPTGVDVLNIGGFSDRVFDVIRAFAQTGGSADHAVDTIRAVAI